MMLTEMMVGLKGFERAMAVAVECTHADGPAMTNMNEPCS